MISKKIKSIFLKLFKQSPRRNDNNPPNEQPAASAKQTLRRFSLILASAVFMKPCRFFIVQVSVAALKLIG